MINRRPKLIATDLDGTIVPHDRPISDRTIDALSKANDLGIKIFFVTGRPPRWMVDIRETFNFGEAICCNGGMYYDLRNDEVLEEWLIQPKEMSETVARLRKAMPTVSFAIESTTHYHREKSYIPRWDVGMDSEGVNNIDDVIHKPSLKLLARLSNREMTSDEMLEIALNEVDDFVNVTHSAAQEDSLLEISAKGVSKGETLAKIAARYQLSADDSVTFGDNPNDFSMLTWASRSFAMSDGHCDGAKFAKALAPSSYDDGVAQIIEELLQLPE